MLFSVMQWDTLVADSRKVCNVLRCCVTFNALNMANVIGYYITDLQKYLALTKITVTIIFLLLFFFCLTEYVHKLELVCKHL